MNDKEYANGFVDGFKAGFEAGQRASTPIWPTLLPPMPQPVYGCNCPPGTICGSTACPRQLKVTWSGNQTITVPSVWTTTDTKEKKI